MENKWREFTNEKLYQIEDLGRSAIFLIPIKKLAMPIGSSQVDNLIHEFLISEFKAYSAATAPSFGFYHSTTIGAIIFDECRQYDVSFVGKERIPDLLAFLAKIAKIIGEECIYVKAGQYSCTVRPPA